VNERPEAARLDAFAKATGAARYTEDFLPRRMLHGVVVRSTQAAARILSVDTSEALRVDGVACVLGPADVPATRFGDVVHDEPVLAQGSVHYVGEPVALVAAESLAAARAAAARVVVHYEPRPAAVSLEGALAPDAPQVHEGRSNLGEPAVVRRGDVEATFAAADHVVETTVRAQRCHQGYIELRSALAELDADGRLIVTMPSQIPFAVRKTLSRVFDLPMTKVVVRVPAFGGGFGGKLHDGLAPYAAALTLATRRPVRVVSSREEELQASNPREGALITMRSAVTRDGRIIGRTSNAYLDSGAYAMDTPIIEALAALHCTGPYDIEAVEGVSQAVSTNTHPTGSFRAPTGPEMCFAYEVHMDDIAEQLGMDRIELRRVNRMRPGSSGPSGQVIQTTAMETVMDRVTEIMDAWRADAEPPPAGMRRGYGFGCTWYYTARGPSGAAVRVNEDGTVAVDTGATEIGTGAVVGGLRELVARDFGIRPEDVALQSGDTSAAPPDMGSEGSRTLYGAGLAALQASAEARDILADAVADELEARPEDLVFSGGRVHVVGNEVSGMTLAAAVAAASVRGGSVVGKGRYMPPPWDFDPEALRNLKVPVFHDPAFHCHAAEVLVDEELGDVTVERYAAVHDTGTVIYRDGVIGQIEGGIVQGLGYALYEDVMIDERGRTMNPSLVDYRLPTVADIPRELTIVTVEDFPSSRGPHGAKGVAEAPILLPAPVIASAVRDAVGARVTELPISAERIVIGAAAEALSGERTE
jgi:CO/xanthine dehydrogenase Mo-binding subunit